MSTTTAPDRTPQGDPARPERDEDASRTERQIGLVRLFIGLLLILGLAGLVGALGAVLVIGAVLLPGAKAPHLVKRTDLKQMKQGSVIVDVAVDQGGCVETIKPTTHENPTYFVDGILHYAVANMPGGVPRTSTLALTNATLPYGLTLARQGWRAACKADPALRLGLNVVEGKVVYPGVAEAFQLPLTDAATVL